MSPERRRWLPPALWATAMLVASSWPSPELPDVPDGSDKVTHLALYAVLAVLLARAERSLALSGRRLALTVLGLSALAALDEWHQQLVPGRSASVGDWIADSVGALLGLATMAVVWRRAPRAA